MADLNITYCEVSLNLGVQGAEVLEAELEKIFPQDRRAACSLNISHDLDNEVLYMNVDPGNRENLMMLSIEGARDIDALRRYCEMVLDHIKSGAMK